MCIFDYDPVSMKLHFWLEHLCGIRKKSIVLQWKSYLYSDERKKNINFAIQESNYLDFENNCKSNNFL